MVLTRNFILLFLMLPQLLFAATTPQKTQIPQATNTRKINSDVRVRMIAAKDQITLRGMFRLGSSKKLSRYTTLLIRRNGNAWTTQVMGQGSSAAKQVKIIKPMLSFSGEELTIDEVKLPREIQILPNNLPGMMDVVAQVDIETYLAGVLPSEMPKAWPLEAIKAQAVASRTYVFKKMHERKRLHFDVENSIFDQVFRWDASNSDSKILQVLNETNHEVLLDPKTKKLVSTYYHSQCGGTTETSKAVWGLDNLKSVKDKYCIQDSKPWEFQVSKQKLSEMVKEALNLTNPGELMNLKVARRTKSGRAERFLAGFSNKEKHFIRGDQMRSILGYGNLRSTRVEIESLDEDWSFKGRGFGHGVGMCQWGAKTMASENHNYRKILSHYYPESNINKF